MCPCDGLAHNLCGYHRRQILDDILWLRRAEAAGRDMDLDIRALRGRLAQLGWKREAVERDLDYGGEEYACTPRPAPASAVGPAGRVARVAAAITNGAVA